MVKVPALDLPVCDSVVGVPRDIQLLTNLAGTCSNTKFFSTLHRRRTLWEYKFRWPAGEITSAHRAILWNYESTFTTFKKFGRKAGPRNWFTEFFSGIFRFWNSALMRTVCTEGVFHSSLNSSRKNAKILPLHISSRFLLCPLQFRIQQTTYHSIPIFQGQETTCAPHLPKLPVEINIYVHKQEPWKFLIKRRHVTNKLTHSSWTNRNKKPSNRKICSIMLKHGSCIGCHVQCKAQGSSFGTYLPYNFKC